MQAAVGARATSCAPSSSGSGPARSALFTSIDSPISLAFLERYPSPADARGLGRAAPAAFLARARYSGRTAARARCWRSSAARPQGRVGELELAARRAARARRSSPRSSRSSAQIKHSSSAQIAAAAARAPRRRDLPLAVQVAGERDLRRGAAGRDRRLPRALPHPRRARRRRRPSRGRGRIRQAQGRAASAGRATSACATRSARWPTAPATGTPGPQTSTPAARARGHDHPRAIRTLGRAWCRISGSAGTDRTPYDPARHRGLQQHITVTIPTPSGPVPDLAATQRMAGAAVTERAARRAEREALDGKPTSATTLRRLTQDVFGDVAHTHVPGSPWPRTIAFRWTPSALLLSATREASRLGRDLMLSAHSPG